MSCKFVKHLTFNQVTRPPVGKLIAGHPPSVLLQRQFPQFKFKFKTQKVYYSSYDRKNHIIKALKVFNSSFG